MILLDMQSWIWWVQDDTSLPARLREYLEGHEKHGFGVSVISCLEVARLVAAGRVTLPLPVEECVDVSLHYPGVSLIELTPKIAVMSTQLPEPFHKDPADRIIVATGIFFGVEIATTDAKIRAYPHAKAVSY